MCSGTRTVLHEYDEMGEGRRVVAMMVLSLPLPLPLPLVPAGMSDRVSNESFRAVYFAVSCCLSRSALSAGGRSTRPRTLHHVNVDVNVNLRSAIFFRLRQSQGTYSAAPFQFSTIGG